MTLPQTSHHTWGGLVPVPGVLAPRPDLCDLWEEWGRCSGGGVPLGLAPRHKTPTLPRALPSPAKPLPCGEWSWPRLDLWGPGGAVL